MVPLCVWDSKALTIIDVQFVLSGSAADVGVDGLTWSRIGFTFVYFYVVVVAAAAAAVSCRISPAVYISLVKFIPGETLIMKNLPPP